jgi:hypothetical protein
MSAVLQAVDAVTTMLVRLAQDPVPAGDKVRPGYIALGLMILMCVATFLLWMNMRKQIRKIDFEENEDEKSSPPSPTAPGNGNGN